MGRIESLSHQYETISSTSPMTSSQLWRRSTQSSARDGVWMIRIKSYKISDSRQWTLTSCNVFTKCSIFWTADDQVGRNIITVDACVHNIAFKSTVTRSFSFRSPSTASTSEMPREVAAERYDASITEKAKLHTRCKCCACVRVEMKEWGE